MRKSETLNWVNPFLIAELKADLRIMQGMEPERPSRTLIRALGVAYLGDNPTRTREKGTKWTTSTPPGFDDVILQKSIVCQNRLCGEGARAEIVYTTSTYHDRRMLMPGFRSLGHLAFQFNESFGKNEFLSVATPERTVEVALDDREDQQYQEMTKVLLALPDYPVPTRLE